MQSLVQGGVDGPPEGEAWVFYTVILIVTAGSLVPESK